MDEGSICGCAHPSVAVEVRGRMPPQFCRMPERLGQNGCVFAFYVSAPLCSSFFWVVVLAGCDVCTKGHI
jgi:hypothetical protein